MDRSPLHIGQSADALVASESILVVFCDDLDLLSSNLSLLLAVEKGI
jgi:hypothetical protein